MRTPLVIYHANCWDGFCAAWVARSKLGEIEGHAAHYGTEPPDVRGRAVYVLDFSYPRETMLRLWEEAEHLVVLDHHATARDALAGLDFCTFDMSKSGGRLAWEHFYADAPSPWLVDYTEDRDLWRHALENSEEVNASLRTLPLDFNAWDALLNEGPSHYYPPGRLITEGRAIRRAERQIVETHVRNASRIAILGHDVPIVNATVLFSEIAGGLAEGEPFGVCYFDRKDGKRQWSLRSRDGGVDVSEIAKQFGGGGHKHAAGFETGIPAATLGATGRLPEGMLSPDDEGELRLAVGHRDGNVVIDFGKPVSWLGFPPAHAAILAGHILSHADALERGS
jgi:oligoribonuclease NrnB/cAMP/cGMP phosphodiesterase (DHH superfamily)